MKKVILLLFLALSISLIAAELNELSIVGKAVKTGDIISASIKDANDRQAACIIFLTDLDVDMDFKPNIELVKLISNPGRYEVYVQPGERVIEVYASGFKPLDVVLSTYGISRLNSGDVYKLEITGEKKVSLIPVVITSNQNGAKVFVDGNLKGTTKNKMVTVNISTGNHKIKIQKDGFSTQEIEKKISEENNSFNFKLTPSMPAAVTITSEPAGATVYIDNLKFGITPKSGFFDAGTYPIRIEKENYETINEQITITEPETKKSYRLTDIRATLTIKTRPNATVKFNGESYKGGITNKKIAPQVLEITVTMPKAETIKRVVTLKPKTTQTIEIYPEVQTGIIQVVCIPTDANIELTGDGGEYYTATGRKTFTDVPIGKYNLIVKAVGYKTHKENFSLIADDTVRKTVALEEGSDIPDNMVFVKGGTFQMGSNNGESDEEPIHSVTVSDFYIGKYEVTQKEWREVMGNNPSYFKGDNLPVENVTWYDAVKYCNKKSIKEGLTPCYSVNGDTNLDNWASRFTPDVNRNANGYRLPTEAEWEYAARGGVETQNSASHKYSGSDNINVVAWYDKNSGGKTHPVGTKKPNELGIYDMSGNVYEWCWDWYNSSYYKSSSSSNPHGANSGSDRVIRGGFWSYNASNCRVANRSNFNPDFSFSDVGFRIIRANP